MGRRKKNKHSKRATFETGDARAMANWKCVTALIAGVATVGSSSAFAQDACKNRGQLDQQYCDDDGDLVADVPKDPTKWKDPSTLVWAYTPVEDPAVYANIFKPLSDHLGTCVAKKIVYYPVQSNSAEIEAPESVRRMITGRAGFTGLGRAGSAGRVDRKSTRLNSSHSDLSRMPSSA